MTTMTANLKSNIGIAIRRGEHKAEQRIIHDLINDAVIATCLPVDILERIVNIVENKRPDEQPRQN